MSRIGLYRARKCIVNQILMRKYYFYKITNYMGQIYLGQTVNVKKRINQYKSGCNPAQKLIHRSIKKYNWDSHTFEIIGEANTSPEGADIIEIDLIKRFNSYWYDNKEFGLNLTKGGKGRYGNKLSEEHLAKLRASWPEISPLKGTKLNEDHIYKATINRKTLIPEKLILNIITDYNSGLTPQEIAKKYNIPRYKVYNIKHSNPFLIRNKDVPKMTSTKYIRYSEEIVQGISKDRLEGKSLKEIGEKYSLSRGSIGHIIRKYAPHLKTR